MATLIGTGTNQVPLNGMLGKAAFQDIVTINNGGTGTTTSTGTGNLVLSDSPTLVTPALGTPSSGTVTNLTGTASININGTVGATTANTGAFTTLTASEIFMGGGTAFVRDYASGYAIGHTPTLPQEIGRLTLAVPSANITIIGEIRGANAQLVGVTRFILNLRSNTLPAKSFTFEQEIVNLGSQIQVRVFEDTTTGLVVLAYSSSNTFQNIGWSIRVQERSNYDYFQTVSVLTPLDTTGLTELLATSVTRTLSETLAVPALAITQTGTAAALAITQTGTGNALLVEDSTSPDSSPFVVDANGRAGFGILKPAAAVHVAGDTIISNVDVINASYDGVSFSVLAQDTTSQELFFSPNGLRMYVLGSNLDNVYEYSLSTAWVVSTAVFVTSFNVTSQDSGPVGLFFRADGTKMYLVGAINDAVYQYTLNTPWSIATASYDSISFSVAAQEVNPTGIFFKPDGLSMYVIGGTGVSPLGDYIYQYTLSTAWDISTSVYLQSFLVGGQDTSPTSVAFTGDGSRMFVLGDAGNDINVYNLTTPWNISTAAFVNVFSVAAQETSPAGIYVKPDGTKMYIVGPANDTVYQYTVPSINLQLTGQTSIAALDVQQDLTVYGNITGNVNIPNLTASKPVFTDASKNLTSIGTIGVANGGTGLQTITANNVLLGNGTNSLQAVAPGTAGNILTSNGTTWTSTTPASGGITYSKYTANVTAVDKQGIIADTTAGSFTVTLPASPGIGTQVEIVDGGNWATNNLTVARNLSTIEGLAEDLVLDIGGVSTSFIYDGTTWELYAQAGVSGSAGTLSVAGGGTGATTLTGILKGNGTSAISTAVAGTDYSTPTGTETLSNKTIDASVNTVKTNEILILAVSDETTSITTGISKVTFRAPFAMTLYQLPRASLATASTSGNPAIDINVGGVSIFSTTLTIDANEKTSTTAATAAVLSTTSVADDAEITVDIDTAGTGAKGLKLTLYYRRT